MGEESIAQFLKGLSISSGAAVEVHDGNEKIFQGRGRMHLRSTPVKTLIGSNNTISVGIVCSETPAKDSVEMAPGTDEDEETFCEGTLAGEGEEVPKE